MRSAQMCRIMLTVSLTFTLFQPLRAAAQESPSYTLPPKTYSLTCTDVGEVVGSCTLLQNIEPTVYYACTDKGPLEIYKKDRQARIDTLQGEVSSLAQDEGVQRGKMHQAKLDIFDATYPENPDALRAAKKALIEAETNLKLDKYFISSRLGEIKALQDEMDKTDTSYKQTVDSNAGKCTCYVEDERTHKCKCTKERWERAVREGNDMRVCGGGQSR